MSASDLTAIRAGDQALAKGVLTTDSGCYRATRIVATISPASSTPEILLRILRARAGGRAPAD